MHATLGLPVKATFAHGPVTTTPRRMETPTKRNPVTVTIEAEATKMFAVNEPITKHSARLMRKQMQAAGGPTRADRQLIKQVIEHGNLLDDEAFYVLLDLLLNG